MLGQSTRRFAIALVVVGVGFSSPHRVRAQVDPLGGLALGVGLSKLSSQVKEIEEKALGGADLLELEAGGQIATLLAQTQSAYQAELNLTFAQLNAQEQQAVNSVASLAQTYISQTYQDANALETKAIGAVHDLPFSHNFPQFFEVAPQYVTDAGTDPIRLQILGDFIDLPKAGYDPTLVISPDTPTPGQQSSATITSTDKSNTYIAFDIPPAAIKSAPDKLSLYTLAITVPYTDKYLSIIPRKVNANFRLPLIVLPPTLGTMSFIMTTQVAGLAKQTAHGGPDAQISDHDDIICGGEHADLAVHTAAPDAGWRVEPNTVNWAVSAYQGNPHWGANCSTLTTACLCLDTEHHGAGTSDKVWFTITFTEDKDITTATDSQPNVVPLDWGTNKVISIPQGATWRATLTRFDGTSIGMATNYSDQYVHVTQSATIINVETAPFNSDVSPQ